MFEGRTMLLSLLALILMSQCALAQGTGSLVGTARDPSGSVIPDTKVVATRVETGIPYEAATNQSGDYSLPSLPVGTYTISFTKEGFQELRVEKIEIHVASKVRQDATLQLAGTTTEVEVIAATPMVKSESAEIGTLVGAQQIVDLPLNGRNVYSLVLLTAGAETGTGTRIGGAATTPSIAGGRGGYTVFRMDGVNINTQNIPSAGATPVLDATEEFRVITTLSPAWFSDMSAVSVASKSGTNEFHGTAYEFLRNNVLDAHPFFQRQIRTPTFTSSKAQLRYNQFGGTVGGPIVKNRTFFFGGVEVRRATNSDQVTTIMPTTAMLNGDFSGFNPITRSNLGPVIDPRTGAPFSGNRIDPSRFNPRGKALADLAFRAPNCPECLNAGLGFNYVAEAAGYNRFERYTGRVDHRLGERDTLFFSFLVNPSESSRARNPGLPGVASHTPNRTQLYTLSWNHIVNPRLLNETRFSYFRSMEVWKQEDDAQGAFPFRNTPFATPELYPMIAVGGYPGWSSSQGYLGSFYGSQIASQSIRTGDNHWSVTNDMTWIRGNHQFRLGGEVIRDYFFVRNNVGAFLLLTADGLPFFWGYTGNAVADLLLGVPFVALTHQTATPVRRAELVERTRTAVYLQDDWKVSSRLTLNLGLRWDYYQRWHDSRTDLNRLGTLDLSPASYALGGRFLWGGTPDYYITGQGLVKGSGSPLIRSQIVDPEWKDFGPRIGLAFRPFNNNKTALRAGYGIYYINEWANAVSFTEQNPPFQFVSQVVNINPDPTQWNGTPWFTAETLFPDQPTSGAGTAGLNPRNRNPYVQQWTLSIQQQISQNILFSVEYLGNHGQRNRYSLNVNAAPFPDATTLAFLKANPSFDTVMADARRPLPNVTRGFIWEDNVSDAWYHAMNVKAEGRFQRLNFSAAYTWAKALDQTSEDNTFAFTSNVADLRLDKSYAAFDHRHRFVASGVYDLPFGQQVLVPRNRALRKFVSGWGVTGITTFETGPPFTVLMGVDTSFRGGVAVRPVLTGSPVFSDIRASNGIYLTPKNFANPALGTLDGGIARNFFHGPGINNFDLGFIKNTSVTDKVRLQFRAEMFNAFNHAQFRIGHQSLANTILPPAAGSTEPRIQYNSASSFGRASARDPRIIQFGLKLIW
ncbi:MAG: TonB-dependent receptor [Acidobacteriota bacterium]